MKVRYSNDLKLTDIARQASNVHADLNTLLRDGHLDGAYTLAELLKETTEKLMYRLNDLKFENTSEIGQG